ncbi:hypothetical protein CDAR_281621 [Caerostris darwini]|uniref:Uncharacterized protein n=1 Tax=Caerostris darwini TaxID=1538125 RepID=A0AAV4R4C5_9ARAC|nr:hypothetical protein CDAR_281621 [Caerostris darwini]
MGRATAAIETESRKTKRSTKLLYLPILLNLNKSVVITFKEKDRKKIIASRNVGARKGSSVLTVSWLLRKHLIQQAIKPTADRTKVLHS